jgi:hypothetical protein
VIWLEGLNRLGRLLGEPSRIVVELLGTSTSMSRTRRTQSRSWGPLSVGFLGPMAMFVQLDPMRKVTGPKWVDDLVESLPVDFLTWENQLNHANLRWHADGNDSEAIFFFSNEATVRLSFENAVLVEVLITKEA